MKRILITGATGFTGRHACRLFASSGWEVIGVTSGLGASVDATVPAGASVLVSCDLTMQAKVSELCRETDPDAILHLAGQNAVDRSWREPDATLAANVMSTVHLLEGMRSCDRQGRLLIVGSMLTGSSLEEAAHPYAFSKAIQVIAALAWHRWYGMQAMAVEPSNLIGPGGSQGLCGKIARWAAGEEAKRAGEGNEIHRTNSVLGKAADRASESNEIPRTDSVILDGVGKPSPTGEPVGSVPFVLSSLEEERDYLDVRDAVLAYELLLREGETGRVYSLGSGTMRKLGVVREAFDSASRTKLDWRIEDRPRPSPQPRDLSALQALGWHPTIPFVQSIEDTLEDERMRLGDSNQEG